MAIVNVTTANTFNEWRIKTNETGTAVGELTNLTEALTRGTDVVGALTDISTDLATAEATIALIPETYVDVAGDTMTGDLNFGDNDKIKIGIGADLEIYHDATDSVIKNATGITKVQGDDIQILGAGGTETLAKFAKDGAVELYHNNIKKVETTANGATVTGGIRISNDGTIGSATTTDAIAIASNGVVTFKDDILIKNGGTIGSATTTDAITIAAAGDVSFRKNVIFEGSTADGFETTVAITNPTADRTWTVPNSSDTFVGKATTDTLQNKTLNSAVLNGTISGTSIKDEDDLTSNSNAHLATQQSIKAYVDAQITLQDLDVIADNNVAIAIDLDSETIDFAGGTGLDSNAAGNTVTFNIDATVTTLIGNQTLTNKTLTSPVLNTGVSGTAIKDEDDMLSNSASHLATQQSIKKYVDDQVTAQDLDFIADSGGALNIDLDSETLTIAGGTGITSVGALNKVTLNIDSTVTTLVGTQTLTNKTLTTPTLTSPVFNTGVSGSAILDSDTMTGVSATKLASSESIKAYVDAQVTAQDLDFQGDSGGVLSIDLDSETLDIAGGTGITSVGAGNTLTLNIDSTVATLTGTQTLTNKTLTSPVMNGTITGDAVQDNIGTMISQEVAVTAHTAANVGEIYQILRMGTTLQADWVLLGVPSTTIAGEGTVFTATNVSGSGKGTGTMTKKADSSKQTNISVQYDDATGVINFITPNLLTGSISGNAATVTVNATTATGAYVGLWDAASGALSAKTDTGITYDATNNKLTVTGDIVAGTGSSFVIGNADMSEGDLEKLDGITNGTAAANKAVVLSANKDIGTIRNLTINGTFSDGNYTFDTSGNVSGLGTISSGAISSSGDISTTGSFIIGNASMSETDLEKLDGITNGTAAANKAVVLNGSKNISGIGTISSGTITTAKIASTGDFTIDATSDIVLDADGGDVHFKDAGTAIGKISNTSSNFVFTSQVDDKDIIFKGQDGTSEITALTLDMSAAGKATFNSDVVVSGNLSVEGTTTTINSATLTVDDKNIELGSVATPTDATANGGGITLKGATDKTILWVNSTDTWDFNQAVKSTNGFVGDVTGDVTGNADTATALETARTIAMTGDVAWTSASFDGSGNVTGSSSIGTSKVTTAKIADLNVTTGKINASAVTTAKIADLNVTTGKIADLNVTTGKIAADAVTGAKIGDDQIDSEHYADNSIDALHLNVSGDGTTSQWLRSDGDGSMSWVAPPNTEYVTATSTVEGLVKIGYAESGKYYPVELSSGKMFVHVPWSDTDTNQLTTFTVSATTDTTPTTISQGDDLFFAAGGTAITCETTADGTVTITNNAPNVSTNLSKTTTTSNVTINSSDGNNIAIGAATTSVAGVMTKALYDNVITNNNKVSNADHTGDVTGSVALAIGDLKVKTGMIDNDQVTQAKMADDSVGSAQMKTLSTLLIKNSAGTTVKTIHGAGA